MISILLVGVEFSTPLTELHDAWWNRLARAMA